ncbi:hypothetical protein BH11MYX1_BH11MYX1_36880 [soil metagenome]
MTHSADTGQGYQQPPATPYHASYQLAAGEAMSICQAFGADMAGCSRYCTMFLAKGLRCQCAPGACP